MSETAETTWPDEVREACFGTCGGIVSQHAPREDLGCSMFEDTLRALAPLVEARVRQAWVEVERLRGEIAGHWRAAEADEQVKAEQAAALAERDAAIARVRAEAWDEGRDAGHQEARAVNPEWPEQTPNPYRTTDDVEE